MKHKNRELNIFSMSALDLFASTMGAFILLSIISLPFFANTHRLDDETLLAQLADTRGRLQQAQQELAQCQSRLQRESESRQQAQDALSQCQQMAQANFLLVLISWNTADDIDLHVTDPQGREFYYRARQHGGSPARFEEDNTRGPGNEIWLHPNVTPGIYRVDYVYYEGQSPVVAVRGAALHKDGRSALPDSNLTSAGQRIAVARIQVSQDGQVSIL